MRLSRLLLIVCALALWPSLACESENLAACQAYTEYFTALPCAAGVDPGVDCNAFADYPCPVPDHFQCLEQTQFCAEGELFVCNNPDDPGCGRTFASCAELLDCSG
jgi:hypothetical protein